MRRSFARLKWELSEVFEKDLLSDGDDEGEDGTTRELESKDDSVNQFIEISRELSQRGYRFVLPVRKLIEKYEEEMRKNIENKVILNELEEQIEKIGKRKRKYLQRMTSKINK